MFLFSYNFHPSKFRSITSVENGIITALMNEMKSHKTPYKNIKIDFDTIDVKRLMDQDLLKSASFIREPANSDNTSSTNFEDKLVKKTGIIEKTIHKFSSSHKPSVKPTITEAEIDTKNLPIIHGSFEVTKTDADITKRKESFSTQTPTSTLRPIIVSQSSIKVKEPVRKAAIIEKVIPVSTTTTTTSTTTTTTTTTSEAPTTIQMPQVPKNNTEKLKANVENPPILDVNLFTSAPVLDREPWYPINPKFPSKLKHQTTTEKPQIISENPLQKYKQPNDQFVKETNLFRNNQKYSDPIEAETEDVTTNPNKSQFYKSFTNSGFSTGGKGIEKLGTSDVRPYPIPVNKLYTDFKIIDPGLNISDVKNENIHVGDKFEHIGGGVIVKKPELSTEKVLELTTTPKIEVTEIPIKIRNDTLKIIHDQDFVDDEFTTELIPKLGDILYDLLDLKDDSKLELESRVEPEKIPPTKLNFHNIRDHILAQTNKPFETTTEIILTSEKPTSSFVEVETVQYNPVQTTLAPTEKIELFPINSKWEFINGTQISFFDKIKNTKKVFNSTLQALIVENEQTRSDEQLFDVKKQQVNNSSNIQNISAIFDTLATKLGISQNVPSKLPPFTTMMNKRNKTRTKATTTTTTIAPKTTTIKPIQTTEIPKIYEDEVIPVLLENGSAEVIIGQAEVEAIDPTRYEELMHLQESTTEMTSTTELVTLLPVKSNSGLRVFKRPNTNGHGHRGFKNSFAESIVRTAVNIRS